MVKNVSIKSAQCGISPWGGYVSPKVKVVSFRSEGVLCASVETYEHESFTLGDSYEIE